jgi:hypothetical protein
VAVGSRTPHGLWTLARAALALAKANEVRVARAWLKRGVAAGRIELARPVVEPPSCVQTAKVRERLLVVAESSRPRRSGACPLPDRSAKTVGGLGDPQRAELVALLAR